MSTIGGIGSYGGISLTGFRNKPGEEQGGLAQLARNRAFAGCRYRRAATGEFLRQSAMAGTGNGLCAL